MCQISKILTKIRPMVLAARKGYFQGIQQVVEWAIFGPNLYNIDQKVCF